jgi:transposase
MTMKGGRSRRRGNLSIEEIAERYRSGLSTDDIALIAGLSATTIVNRLREHGIEMRKRGGKPGACDSYLFGKPRRRKVIS